MDLPADPTSADPTSADPTRSDPSCGDVSPGQDRSTGGDGGAVEPTEEREQGERLDMEPISDTLSDNKVGEASR